MTKTPFSVNDDARPQSSRRALLRGLAIAPVAVAAGAGAGTFIAKAAEASPDAELLTFVHEYSELAPRSDAAFGLWEIALDRYKDLQPAPPEALFLRRHDPIALCAICHSQRSKHDGKDFLGDPGLVDYLRAHPSVWETERRRQEEVVAAYDEWQAALAHLAETTGYTAANEESERRSNEAMELRARIAETPATTMEGLLAKASVALGCFDGDVQELTECVKQNGSMAGEDLCAWVGLDIVRMLQSRRGGVA
jgi:hypothetical protein